MKKLKLRGPVLTIVLLALGCALPVLIGMGFYWIHVLTALMLLIIVGSSINVVMGYAGQISLGNAGFYAIGAYTAGWLAKYAGLPFVVCLIAGAVAAALVGFVLGGPSLRLSGPYLAIVTVGFGWIVQILLVQLEPITGGAEGMMRFPRPNLFGLDLGSPQAFMAFVLVVCVGLLLFIKAIGPSRLGRAWRLVKEDALAASSFGVNVTMAKLSAFALSAAIAGLAGGLYAFFSAGIFPDTFGLTSSIRMVLVAAIGGLGYPFGPVVGATVLTAGMEGLRIAGPYQSLLMGTLIILVCVFTPGGLLSINFRRLFSFAGKPSVTKSEAR